MKEFNLEKLKDKLKNQPSFAVPPHEKLFLAAIFVPLIKRDGEYHLLFEKRAPHIRQGGQVSFPGGGVEKRDSSLKKAAIRETTEEINVKAEELIILGKLRPHLIPNRFIVYPFVGEIKKEFSTLQGSKDEVDYLFTVPLSYLLNVPLKEFLPEEKLVGTPERKLYQFQYQGEVIWGLTADVIITLREIFLDEIKKENL